MDQNDEVVVGADDATADVAPVEVASEEAMEGAEAVSPEEAAADAEEETPAV